ncbi:MAG TPA: hypothetical protein VH415_10495 [Nitrososphaeraceae archaeon]|jgi:hypothetical protein
MTINKEIMTLCAVLVMIFLLSLKVVYGIGIPATQEDAENAERDSQTGRSQLESYIVNHNISIRLNDETKNEFHISADSIPLEKVMQFADTYLLQITVAEHQQRCEAGDKVGRINYTISNSVVQFPNRTGIC